MADLIRSAIGRLMVPDYEALTAVDALEAERDRLREAIRLALHHLNHPAEVGMQGYVNARTALEAVSGPEGCHTEATE